MEQLKKVSSDFKVNRTKSMNLVCPVVANFSSQIETLKNGVSEVCKTMGYLSLDFQLENSKNEHFSDVYQEAVLNDSELEEEKEMLLSSKDPTFMDFFNRRNFQNPKIVKKSSNFTNLILGFSHRSESIQAPIQRDSPIEYVNEQVRHDFDEFESVEESEKFRKKKQIVIQSESDSLQLNDCTLLSRC